MPFPNPTRADSSLRVENDICNNPRGSYPLRNRHENLITVNYFLDKAAINVILKTGMNENYSYTPNPAPSPPPRQKRRWLLWGAIFSVFICLGCLTVTAASIYVWYEYEDELVALREQPAPTTASRSDGGSRDNGNAGDPDTSTADISSRGNALPAPTTAPAEPTATATAVAAAEPTSTPPAEFTGLVPAEIEQGPIPPQAAEDLRRLLETDYPIHDYFAVNQRLGNADLGPRTVQGTLYDIGDTQQFYVDGRRITAVLEAATTNTEFWVEEELDLDPIELQEAADRLQNEYFIPLQTLFGSHWDPGIDNNPRVTFLHISESGGTELGFFVSDNQYPRTLFNRSNEQEMVYMNMGELRLGSDLYYATLVHEYQHLIQWHVDASESLWLNEGLSQLAEIYLGYDDTAGTSEYLRQTDVQLNSWDYEDDYVMAHYAAAYLFSVYMWEQLGDEAIQALARHPANGMAAVDAVLVEYAPERPLSSFISDWAIANYLDFPDLDPRYGYKNLNLRPVSTVEELDSGEQLDEVFSLNQFGVHYFDLTNLRGENSIRFAGDTVVDLTTASPLSGDLFWFAPPIDETNARLTASFDLTNLERATLRYNVWYDLEDDYDYAYVSISRDGGATWEPLMPTSFRTGEYGPAYNGKSANRTGASAGGWLKESISLNQFVGDVVQIRFEVLTDSGITHQGFALDDISIPEYNYLATDDDGSPGWVAEGFVSTGWQLPQYWSVQWISEGPEPIVTPLTLNELNQGDWVIDAGKGGGVLVIMPQTPFVYTPANYWLEIGP